MDFKKFCNYTEKIEDTASQTEKTEYIAEMFQSADGINLNISALYVQGKLFPDWDDSKISVGPATMYKAISEASELTKEEVEDLVAEYGGIGEACEHIDFTGANSGQQKLSSLGGPTALSVEDVHATIDDLSNVSGSGSQETKIKTLANVLLDCSSGTEAKYFSRLVLEEMRIGVGAGIVRDAIAEAFIVDVDAVQHGLMVTNDAGLVAQTASEGGESALKNLEIEIGRPIAPMLAKDGDMEEVMDDVSNGDGQVAVETKYDGARLQCHLDGDEVTLYTRRLNEVTNSLPDVVEVVKDTVDADTAIIDTEVVAYESEDSEEALPFQEVMKRLRRKYDIEEKADEIHMDIHAFDILYKDGSGQIKKPLTERRNVLEDTVGSEVVADQYYTDSLERIAELEQQALADGDEGLMVKNPSSEYLPDDRGWNWVKIKPEPETLDCVVVGGEWGEGRRAEWVGTFMLAVRDDDTGEFHRIGKVATGVTDEQLEDLTERFEPLIENEDGKDITFKPELVFEVGYEEIQPSPQYESGYGLRFPRFIGVREDKSTSDIDTVSRVEDLA